MKKFNLNIPAIILVFTIVLFSCHKKDQSGVNNPGYKEENGTGGNPIKDPIPNQAATNPATKNSSLLVGGAGWVNPSCASITGTLKGMNGSVEVTLNFLAPATSGTYFIADSPSNLTCSMVVKNAPNQPSGILWHAKSGTVILTVNTTGTTTSINAKLSDIVCTQETFSFPQVNVSGVLGCN